MSDRRGLLSRVRNRLANIGIGRKPEGPGIGPAFPPAYEEEWNELVEQVDNYTQKIGAAVVQTWEVGAAELGRVVIGRADEKTLIERYSDALVPTLTPFQDLHKKCSGAFAKGLAAGNQSNQLKAATAPLVEMVDGLGGRAQEGWEKTVTYLEPLVAMSKDPAATRAKLLAGGQDLDRACRDAQAVLQANLDAMHKKPTLWAGVCDSWDNWQQALVRDVEISLSKVTRALVADLREGLE